VFSVSATKIASKATEGAIKIGGIASQKVADISVSVGEKASAVECSFSLFNFSCLFSQYFCLFCRSETSSTLLSHIFLLVIQAASFPRGFPTKIKFMFFLCISVNSCLKCRT
jgi:hypothetical protein